MIRTGMPHILVVDDEPVMRTITESVLSQHEFEVTTAASAEQAIALIGEGKIPDLLLLDILMPGMNGFEACRILRQQYHLEHLPIIMLTALDDQTSIDEAYRCGATDFITKPLNIPLLPHRVRYLLRSSTAFKNLVHSQLTLIHTQRIAHLGNWTMDQDDNIVDASQQYLDFIAAPALPVPVERLLARVHREDHSALMRCRADLRQGRAYSIDFRLRSLANENTWHHFHERGFPQLDDKNQYIGANGFTQDISERVAQEERIRQLAWKDQVTGLNNRDRMLELLEREIESGNDGTGMAMAMMFIHLANLRNTATVLGQDVADAAVRALSSRVKSALELPSNARCGLTATCMRDAKLARHDEDSFTLSLPGTLDREDIGCFARTLQETLGRPMLLMNDEVIISPYIGIAYYPEDASEPAELIRRAMLVALNSASCNGSAISFFDEKHDHDAAQRVVLERGLRTALEQGGQLKPYFQPKISAATGEIVGAEVLLRWEHPVLGLIAPDRFIPLAEEIGLIHPISEWLIGHVCELIAGWQASGKNVGAISINLSADSFFQRTLVKFIDDVLARTGVPTEQLVIELTESVLMRDAETAHQVIAGLRDRGIRISLDDFGTGFSSLGYLNRFSIDEIKIDRSFVIDLEDQPKKRALVQAIITLGSALGLKVVGEGIETPGQAEMLKKMGCDIFQGYLFARPMPADQFAAFRLPGTAGGGREENTR